MALEIWGGTGMASHGCYLPFESGTAMQAHMQAYASLQIAKQWMTLLRWTWLSYHSYNGAKDASEVPSDLQKPEMNRSTYSSGSRTMCLQCSLLKKKCGGEDVTGNSITEPSGSQLVLDKAGLEQASLSNAACYYIAYLKCWLNIIFSICICPRNQ